MTLVGFFLHYILPLAMPSSVKKKKKIHARKIWITKVTLNLSNNKQETKEIVKTTTVLNKEEKYQVHQALNL